MVQSYHIHCFFQAVAGGGVVSDTAAFHVEGALGTIGALLSIYMNTMETTDMKQEDTHSYKGWLNSDSFWKRALAVLGYGVAAQLAISLSIMFVGGVLGFIIASVF